MSQRFLLASCDCFSVASQKLLPSINENVDSILQLRGKWEVHYTKVNVHVHIVRRNNYQTTTSLKFGNISHSTFPLMEIQF